MWGRRLRRPRRRSRYCPDRALSATTRPPTHPHAPPHTPCCSYQLARIFDERRKAGQPLPEELSDADLQTLHAEAHSFLRKHWPQLKDMTPQQVTCLGAPSCLAPGRGLAGDYCLVSTI